MADEDYWEEEKARSRELDEIVKKRKLGAYADGSKSQPGGFVFKDKFAAKDDAGDDAGDAGESEDGAPADDAGDDDTDGMDFEPGHEPDAGTGDFDDSADSE